MNVLVKKEIRLLLPGWMVAVLLALVQAITRPYDFYVAFLLFFGLTIMALTPFGRESSLDTFSSLLALPAERLRIWQAKLAVLAVAFLIVFGVWLLAFGIAFVNSQVDASDREDSYNLFITICLIATATFTGGLWSTLLLRQIAGAFWLTLLVPAVLSGISAVFLAQAESGSTVIAVLCVVLGVYSIGGFLFARWLFFRAQDVGWSGGVIAMPEWKFLSGRAERAGSVRTRKPIFALIKKEFQLQQVSLLGAAGLLVLHIGTIVLRTLHHFHEKSASAILLALFWMLWLVMAPIIGSMSVAEERRLGVMEGQLCQPVSRRIQFVIKAFLTLFLGTFLGGVVPVLAEELGAGASGGQSVFAQPETAYWGLAIVAFAAWMALVSFFASTLAKSFLQAVGLGVATFFGCMVVVPLFTSGRMLFLDSISAQHLLPLIIAVPTIIVTLLWLAYLNFNNFRDGWPLARRNVGGIIGALLFIFVSSNALYHRVWEIFEPAEPAHGPAKFSLANPPTLRDEAYDNLLVRLPDGRVWTDYLNRGMYDYGSSIVRWWHSLVDPWPNSGGAQRFIAGSNWVSATASHVDLYQHFQESGNKPANHIVGYLETVGIQPDGTLWISAASRGGAWTGDKMNRFGDGTDWRQVVRPRSGVLLLKSDGTLWRWGTNHFESSSWRTNWPNLRTDPLYQIGTNSDWKEIGGTWWNNLAGKADGSVWGVGINVKSGEDELRRDTNLDQVSFQTLSQSGNGERAYVRPDGTLWMSRDYQQDGASVYSSFVRVGTETNWTAVALNWQRMVALKSDGSLWQWHFNNPWGVSSQEQLVVAAQQPPARLGIHSDWVGIANTWQDMVALAADGSLWLWPDREQYEEFTLVKLPKQPQFLGNVLGKAD